MAIRGPRRFTWVSNSGGRISLLIDRDGAIAAETCPLPPELRERGAAEGETWSWFIPGSQTCGTAASEAEARRRCEAGLAVPADRVA